MKKLAHWERSIYLMLVLLTFSLSACLDPNSPIEPFDDQVQAGVAATLTKEAFVRSVDSARQTEAVKNLPTETTEPSSSPTPFLTITPSITPTPEPIHVMLPGAPIYLHTFVKDLVTVDLAKDKTALDDNYAWSRFERPYTARKMEYRDYLDIYRVNLRVTDPWVYFTFVLIGKLPKEGDIRYSIELDLDHEGRGEFLVMVSLPPDTEWTTDGVLVLEDADGDIGGVFPLYMENPGGKQNGYEREIFANGQGEDRDLAWVRRDPDNRNQIQIAIKDSLIGTLGFLWSAWADEGLRDPSLFDINDHYTFEEAGSPNKDNYRYPVKAVALIDSTCRSWYGYIPSGTEPGLCFAEEQLRPSPPGYGWCKASATSSGCDGNICLVDCPTGKFCVPCKLP
jgi:hypothetical protein